MTFFINLSRFRIIISLQYLICSWFIDKSEDHLFDLNKLEICYNYLKRLNNTITHERLVATLAAASSNAIPMRVQYKCLL